MNILSIEVERLRQGAVELDFSLTPAKLDLTGDREFSFEKTVTGTARVSLVGTENVRMVGRMATSARAACVRCLRDMDVPLDVRFDLVFLPEPNEKDKARFVELRDDEKLYYKGDYVHPAEQLREELLVALPYLPGCTRTEPDVCSITGERLPALNYGVAEEEIEEKPEPVVDPAASKKKGAATSEVVPSWKAQLEGVKRKIKG